MSRTDMAPAAIAPTPEPLRTVRPETKSAHTMITTGTKSWQMNSVHWDRPLTNPRLDRHPSRGDTATC